MDLHKYGGMDVHRDTIVITVLNARGKLGLEAVIEAKTLAALDFFR